MFFFFNDTATTEIYTLSLHDALPICNRRSAATTSLRPAGFRRGSAVSRRTVMNNRSEEHTSELQSRLHLVCRLLLEKKKPVHVNLLAHRHRVPIARANAIDDPPSCTP